MAIERTAAMMPRTTPARSAVRPLAGAGNIFRKEVLEWFRTRGFWLTSVVTTLLVGCVSVGVFIHEGGLSHGRLTISPHTYRNMMEGWFALSLTLGNYLMIALTMGILVKEEETGTAQWVFTKPVSRVGYGLAKYGANVLLAALAAVVIPGLLFLGSMQLLYVDGVQHWGGAFAAMGIASFHVAVIIAIILALSTVFRSQAPVAGVVFGLGFLPFVAGRALSEKWVGLTPVWMGEGASQAAAGMHISTWEPMVASLLYVPLCVAFACWRLRRKQLQ
jgi:ABC-type transport system involved in multi-copper enzyme maturation permease subunit